MSRLPLIGWLMFVMLVSASARADETRDDQSMTEVRPVTLNLPDNGYRGVWYANMPMRGGEYNFKYSGGLGTYCDYHQPIAVYCKEANKTFFCYGGTTEGSFRKLHHMVSYYDHATGKVPRPTCLLNKRTGDAHDNPVISVDKKGHIWIFSSSHGRMRPSYIHRSKRPHDVAEFELVVPVRDDDQGQQVVVNNYSYPQFWYDNDHGFLTFLTRYRYPVARTSCFTSSPDGVHWTAWQRLAAIGEGHYQTSAICPGRVGTVMNYHPKGKGLNWRTNLYYLESDDQGKTWHAADGRLLSLPLTEVANPALVIDYESQGILVYLKDFVFDHERRPVIVYGTSRGYQPGPENGPRELRLARWNGKGWDDRLIAPTDHNYDSASLYIEQDGTWQVIAPTEPGPQPYCTGGEMVLWRSRDEGETWDRSRQLTEGSVRNHTYARRPVNAHPDFYAIWADGNAQEPSESHLYFCNRQGEVFRLPRTMEGDEAQPERVPRKESAAATATR